jgi:RNA polymerase sigma-70 factor, ECF subfamily
VVGEIDQPGEVLLALYDRALPVVYGYLFDRCRDQATAEDLTSETFLAAVKVVHDGAPTAISLPWMIGVARHKLVDHWRRRERADRIPVEPAGVEDPWDTRLESMRAEAVLECLGGHHRAALTLRYVDGLSVPEVADVLGRTVHATEALLVRARVAFRKAYEGGEDGA